MKKWDIINEYNIEMHYKIKHSEIIDALFDQGLGNCTITLATVRTDDEAIEMLKKYKCTSVLANTFASKIRVGNFYYAAEIEYNAECDDWEQTGKFIFAEIAEDDE